MEKICRMKINCVLILLVPVVMVITNACTYDKVDEAYPIVTCDSVDVRYSVEIKSILDQYCQPCHGGTADAGAGIQLYDYSVISTFALDGQFTYGTLLSSVLWEGGASKMPQGNPQIDDCSISQIRAWVDAGAPNN